MRALVMQEENVFEFKEVAHENLEENEVRVTIKATALCSFDFKELKECWTLEYPVIIGHEFSGIITEIGSNVSHLKINDEVIGIPFLPCFTCDDCVASHYSLCENAKVIGQNCPGAIAESVVLNEKQVLLISGISFEEAALIEPLAKALHNIVRVQPKITDSAIVFAANARGLLTIQALYEAGVRNIMIVDRCEKKLSKAITYGATATINPLTESIETQVRQQTGGKGANLAFDCDGSPIFKEQCILSCGKRGKVIFLENSHEHIVFQKKTIDKIMRDELKIEGYKHPYSYPYPGKVWETAIDLVKKGDVNLMDLLCYRFPLDDAEYAVGMLQANTDKINKVLIVADESLLEDKHLYSDKSLRRNFWWLR